MTTRAMFTPLHQLTRPPMSDLASLLERVQKATGPDRELDAAICATLRYAGKEIPDWAHRNFPTWRGRPDGRVEVVHEGGRGGMHWAIPSMTASIDAALALVQEKLPGWNWSVMSQRPQGKPFAIARVARVIGDDVEGYDAIHDAAPLAILSALLRALIAQSATKDGGNG